MFLKLYLAVFLLSLIPLTSGQEADFPTWGDDPSWGEWSTCSQTRTQLSCSSEPCTEQMTCNTQLCPTINCGDPGEVQNADRSGSNFTFGQTVNYVCNAGYRLSGSSSRVCQESGSWSGTSPSCHAIDCGDPGMVQNANKCGSNFTFGQTVNYVCNAGYRLSGSPSRVCQESGSWSGSSPLCQDCVKECLRFCENGSRKVENGCELCECVKPLSSVWGQWSACSPPCGIGVKTRKSVCAHSNCQDEGPTMEANICVNCECSVWDSWAPWGGCSCSCGDFGSKSRTRQCANKQECQATDREVTTCWNGPCQ